MDLFGKLRGMALEHHLSDEILIDVVAKTHSKVYLDYTRDPDKINDDYLKKLLCDHIPDKIPDQTLLLSFVVYDKNGDGRLRIYENVIYSDDFNDIGDFLLVS